MNQNYPSQSPNHMPFEQLQPSNDASYLTHMPPYSPAENNNQIVDPN